MQRLAVLTTVAVVAALGAPPPGAAGATPAATCFGKKATVLGTKGNDQLFGTSGPDVIVGLGGRDTIKGGRGNDLICGKAGADRLFGGPGNDRLDGGLGSLVTDGSPWRIANDVFLPGPGSDLIVPGYDKRAGGHEQERDLIVYASAGRRVRVDLPGKRVTGEGTDRLASTKKIAVVGSRFADRMTGGAANDVLYGYAGADVLEGGSGNDKLFDHENPWLWSRGEGDDADRLLGGPGADIINANKGADTIAGGSGADQIHDGGQTADRIFAGPGNDLIWEHWTNQSGAEVRGGDGKDYLEPHLRVAVPTTIDLRSGVTTIKGRATTTMGVSGVEDISWSGGPLTFHGTSAAERIWMDHSSDGALKAYGYGGNDLLFGTSFDDLLDGGTGTDTGIAGEGHDRCISIEDDDDCEVTE